MSQIPSVSVFTLHMAHRLQILFSAFLELHIVPSWRNFAFALLHCMWSIFSAIPAIALPHKIESPACRLHWINKARTLKGERDKERFSTADHM